ncbi:MAG: DEAD/DEAH box helicase, partial [Candidatus Omnitrophica bacterium]|nr:DEAD/DEAH box helicase [Candidatus Omnitrophota bacterium]
DSGDSKLKNDELKAESTKLIKYFLASLTVPEEELWVNLSPYEKDRIIPDAFGITEMGRDLLAQDYMLKQLTASLMFPEGELGKNFWERVYQRAQKELGTTEIPLNTFSKVWIVPQKAVVYENQSGAFLAESRLKVMLEADYVAMANQKAMAESLTPVRDVAQANWNTKAESLTPVRDVAQANWNTKAGSSAPATENQNAINQIIREIIIPEIEREVNEGKTFAPLRQVFNSVILAAWYKEALKEGLLNKLYSNQRKVNGIEVEDREIKQKIYDQYLEAFKKGVYDIIKEDYDPDTQTLIERKYFSGGVDAGIKEGVMSRVPGMALPKARGEYSGMSTGIEPFKKGPDTAMLAISVDNLLEHVIVPVSGALPDNVKVKTNRVSVEISHTADYEGEPVEFKYKITFGGEKVESPRIPSRIETNIIKVPEGVWNEDTLRSVRNAWRATTIADPVLNKRFTKKTVELEEFQVKAVDRISESLRLNNRSLAVMATGAGKTVVAFDAMDKFLTERKNSLEPGEDPGVIIFMVDNQIILEQSEQSLARMFPGKYKAGRMYGGNKEAEIDAYRGDTDIIFATSLSLSNKNRLERLLKSRKVAALIVDEVHHLPAQTQTKIFSRIQEDPATAFMGFTATPVRPDEASVISFFGYEVPVDYPTSSGMEEGYLVKFNYLDADSDILESLGKKFDFDPAKVGIIEEGTPLSKEYKRAMYDDSRFPDLLKLYQDHVKDNLAENNLILAPNQERARALAAYFASKGVAAITLTSEDRQRDPKREPNWFEDHYQAWKTGKWPEGSIYSNEPVPKVVIAVDIFREGTDIPSINMVMLWADTNSIIRFIQGIGRGLRPSPFKTHLTILDTVGLHRKAHLLRYLGSLIKKGRAAYKRRAKDEDWMQDRVEEDKLFGEAEETGGLVAANVSKAMSDFLEDIPSRLDDLYEGVYELMAKNPDHLRLLDEFLAKRLEYHDGEDAEFPIMERFKRSLEYFAGMLTGESWKDRPDEVETDRQGVRNSLRPLFFVGGFYSEKDQDKRIPALGPQRFVFYRLMALLMRSNMNLTEEMIYKAFPEFDPRLGEIYKKRAKTLKLLRQMVFGLTPVDMIQELIASHKKAHKGNIDHKSPEGWYLLAQRESIERGEVSSLEILSSEGAIEKPNNSDAKPLMSGRKFQKFPALESIGLGQKELIGAYLGHEKLSGLLTVEDFELDRDSFLGKLIRLGLVLEDKAPETFIRAITKNVKEYEEATRRSIIEEDVLNGLRDDLLQLLKLSSEIQLPEVQDLKNTALNNFKGLSEIIDNALKQLGENKNEKDEQIRKGFDDLLEQMGIKRVVEPESLPGVKITTEKLSGEMNYSIRIEQTDNTTVPEIFIRIRNDDFNRTHAFILSGADQQFEPDTMTLELFYNNLTAEKRAIFIEQIKDALNYLSDKISDEMVFVTPQRPNYKEEQKSQIEKDFYADLLTAMLDPQNGIRGFILGPLKQVTTRPHYKYGLVSTEQTDDVSNIPYISRSEARHYSAVALKAHIRIKEQLYAQDPYVISTYKERLAQVYLRIYNNRVLFGNGWSVVKNKLSSYPEDGAAKAVAERLLNRLNWTINGFSHDYRYYLLQVQAAFDLLDSEEPNNELKDHRI